MNPLTKDSAVVMGVLLALLGGTYLAVLQPQGRKTDQIRTQIATEKANLAAEDLKASVVPEMVRQLEAMKLRYRDFDRRLPKSKELGGFLKEISENMDEERLTSPAIEPGTPMQEEHFRTLPIILRFKSPYMSLADFLGRIDRMERLTRVQKLSATLDPDGERLDITMQLNIYFTES